MRNPFQFYQSEDGRDLRLALSWVSALLVLGIALNCLALARFCAAGGEALSF